MNKPVYNYTNQHNNDLQSQMMLQMSRMLARQSEADLWTFDGTKTLDYPLFKRRFFTIYQEGGYSSEQGVAKLDKYIQGEARDLIDIALKTASEPSMIFVALDKVYGRSDAIKREIKQKIDKLPYVTDWNQFRDFSCVVKNIFIATEYLKDTIRDTHTFMEKLVVKLAPHLAAQFGSYCTEKNISEGQENLENLANWVDSMSRITTMMLNANWDNTNNNSNESFTHSQKKFYESPVLSRKCSGCKGECKTLEHCSVFNLATYQQRRKILDDSKACFICLGYHKGKCSKAKPCNINGCTRFHHKLLHKDQIMEEQMLTTSELEDGIAMLKFIPVTIKGPLGTRTELALLDDGSTVTLIDEYLADELGLKGNNIPLLCSWTNGKYRYDENSKVMNAEIKGIKKGMSFVPLRKARTVKEIGIPAQNVDWEIIKQKFPYTIQADTSLHGRKPRIMIGQSNAHLLRIRNSIQPSVNQPCISRTCLGWILHGPTGIKANQDTEQSYSCSEVSDDNLHEAVKQFFKLDEAMTQAKFHEDSKQDALAIKKIQESISYNGERYVVGLPWKEDTPELPETYGMAMKRLVALEKKLQKDPNLSLRYEQEMQKLLDKGYAVEVKSQELKICKYKWYLPHFYVKNPNKPDKIRVVFDAAAKVFGKSLNDHLLSGPDLLTSLFGNLLRFRKNNIAWTSDVQEMFNQVMITEEDSYAQLYLWRHLNDKVPPKIYRMKAMLFGITSSPFLSQFVKNYNADGYDEEYPKAVSEIKNSFYVDDWLSGCHNELEAIELVNQVNQILLAGGFYLRNYMSNSVKLLNSMTPELRANQNVGTILNDKDVNRVLGLLWNANSDQLSFATSFNRVKSAVMKGEIPPTKRHVLSAAMSLFDPTGLLTPYTIKPRILLQRIWREGIHWDDQIKGKLLELWICWLNELKEVAALKIPRLYCNNFQNADRIEIHTFCDAGEDAYSAAVYFRINEAPVAESCLVAAKAKVTPLKTMTIPKLELQAALIGARLTDSVIKEMNCNISQRYYWTDSKTVLLWLQTDKKLISFVACRIGEILDRTKMTDWRWVPSKQNPADLSTKEKN